MVEGELSKARRIEGMCRLNHRTARLEISVGLNTIM